MVLAMTFLAWGIILMLGPTFLRMVLKIASSIVPVSLMTVRAFAIFTILVVFVGILYKSTIGGKIYKKYYHEKGKIKGVRKVFRRMLTVLHVLGITGVVLIICNPFIVYANDVWAKIIEEHATGFRHARYVGVVLIAMAVGFLIGMFYQRRKRIVKYRQNFIQFEEQVPMLFDSKARDEEKVDDEL